MQQSLGLKQRTTITLLGQSSSSKCSGIECGTNSEVLSLIEMPKNGNDRLSGETPWMFDSGAFFHMTGNPRALQRAEKIVPISIGLPNGAMTVATHHGSVTLGYKLTLNNVLYVPTLQFNLISIAKLCKDMRCLVTFSDDNWVL